jgi:hypothetical protein
MCGSLEATDHALRLPFTRPRDRDGLTDTAGGRGRTVTLEHDPTMDNTDR